MLNILPKQFSHLQLTLEQCGGSDAPILSHQQIHMQLSTPQNVNNSLLLMGSFIDHINRRLTHMLYIICILYCILRIKLEGKNGLRKAHGKENTLTGLCCTYQKKSVWLADLGIAGLLCGSGVSSALSSMSK